MQPNPVIRLRFILACLATFALLTLPCTARATKRGDFRSSIANRLAQPLDRTNGNHLAVARHTARDIVQRLSQYEDGLRSLISPTDLSAARRRAITAADREANSAPPSNGQSTRRHYSIRNVGNTYKEKQDWGELWHAVTEQFRGHEYVDSRGKKWWENASTMITTQRAYATNRKDGRQARYVWLTRFMTERTGEALRWPGFGAPVSCAMVLPGLASIEWLGADNIEIAYRMYFKVAGDHEQNDNPSYVEVNVLRSGKISVENASGADRELAEAALETYAKPSKLPRNRRTERARNNTTATERKKRKQNPRHSSQRQPRALNLPLSAANSASGD